MSVSNQHSRAVRDREALMRWLREAVDELEKAHRVLDDHDAPMAADDGTPITMALRIAVAFDNLEEQLEAAQKAQHVQNLEWAISLAESDPLYAEIFRPYFQKIVDALASNPASEPDS